ncbi:PP2C family protein-serine/threonine phosphatase [Bifidobacterium jacchi]|uniref:PP2C family protein-serine/threonine phosphatase n=1 Tax=Bifidobacterium jacchi TaxID=2490545 RepID=UPI003BAC756B
MPNSPASQSLFMYSTTVSDVGTVRANNQDSSFAGEHLAAICDGMGGHAGGDTASTIAIRSLAHIERDDVNGDVLKVTQMMETSVMAAHDAIVGKAKRERKLAGMGTTVTAVALVNGYWALAHIGDSRAYLLRGGKLTRMTHDHSYVQHLIDTGRITPAEAKNHPQRNVVMRVLGDFDIDPRPDITIRKAHPADRWLLCSDGLCGVLEDSTIEQVMAECSDQEECAQLLVSMALKAGSTDNVTAVIADATLALDAAAFDIPHQTLLVGGAASASLEPIADIVNEPVATPPALRDDDPSPAQRAGALAQEARADSANGAASGRYAGAGDANGTGGTGSSGAAAAESAATAAGASAGAGGGVGGDKSGNRADQNAPRVVQPSGERDDSTAQSAPDTGEIPIVRKKDGRLSTDPNDPEVAKAIRHEQVRQRKTDRARSRRGRLVAVFSVIVSLAALCGIGWGVYIWSQSQYYLGTSDGVVTIYQGVNTNIFGIRLSHEVKKTDIQTSSLPQSWRDQLDQGISVSSYDEAESHAQFIESERDKDSAANAYVSNSGDSAGDSADGSAGGSADNTNGTDSSNQSTTQQQEGGTKQ